MKSLHPISQKPVPDCTRAFWRDVDFFIGVILTAFGGAAVIAGLHNFSRAQYKLLASWLCKAEVLVRKLILIDAAEIQIEAKHYSARPAVERDPKRRGFHLDHPEFWRVSFRLSEPQAAPSPEAPSSAAPSNVRGWSRCADPFPDPLPLAKRLEALLRVFDAPEAYVQRAARLLRRKAPKLDALLTVPVFEGYEETFEPLLPLLWAIRAQFKPSDTS